MEKRFMPVTFRPAEEKDIALLLKFIRALAEYEHMLDQVVADEKTLADWLFDKRVAEAFFAMEGETEVGFALYFHNFSTFLGRGGIYLEDLFVLPEHRGKGYGKAILAHLAQIARERGCGRLEWACLDWNKPSIDFYLSLGAKPMNEWTVYRVSGDALTQLAGEEAKAQTTHWEELS
jgi:GNAT superfamily N-acetyltransferase